MNHHFAVSAAIILAVCARPLHAGDPPAAGAGPDPALAEARLVGWRAASVIVGSLEAEKQRKFPGIEMWLADFRKVAEKVDPEAPAEALPAIDADALITRNPNFWRATFEVAPGDPAWSLLHGGLLLAGGEAVRASHVLGIAGQAPEVPEPLQKGMWVLISQAQRAGKGPNALVYEGIALHDRGDFDGAIAKHREALALWPQNGFAHYEVGFALRAKAWVAAGKEPPPLGETLVNPKKGPEEPAEVADRFALARRHDPFQISAYQGSDPEILKGLLALAQGGMRDWDELQRQLRPKWNAPVDDELLGRIASSCQVTGNHELALTIRRVLVIRRGRFDAEDHPFISASLRGLVPGVQTERTLKRLAGEEIELKRITEPADPR